MATTPQISSDIKDAALAERGKDLCPVLDQQLQRLIVTIQNLEYPVQVVGERSKIGTCHTQIPAAAVDRHRILIEPVLQRLSGLAVECVDELIELPRILHI